MADRNPGVGLYHLRVLGGLHLEGPGGAAVGLAARRRPLALLAVLAVHGEQGLSRDRAAALLWGDTDDKHALRSLSDSLYTIRAELGPDAVLSTSTELTLNPAVVGSDVAAFTAALRRGDREAAVQAWGGPLLEGFHLSGAEGFEEWLAAERRRLGGEFGDALEALSAQARKDGKFADAVTGLRRLAALDPYNSRIAVELARTLAQSRDPGNAVQVLRDHVDLLRSALGAEPDAAVVRLMGELRAGAGRAAAGVGEEVRAARAAFDTASGDRWGSDDGAGAVAAQALAGGAVPAGSGTWRARIASGTSVLAARPALAIAALVGLVVVGWGAVRLAQARFGPPIHSLAVLPLRNLTGDTAVGPFVDGVTEELTGRLGRVAGLQVTSRTSAALFGNSKLTSRRIAAALGVEGLVEGAVIRWGDEVRVTVQAIDARTDRHLGAETVSRPWDSLYTVPARLADAVLRDLRISPAPAERPLVAKHTARDPRVAALLAQGRPQEALALDSLSARAWAARSLSLADSTWWWPQPVSWRPTPYVRAAREAADRAMRLDSTESDARVALGVALSLTYEWPEAERELRHAIELQPSDALAHTNLAATLSTVGRFDEAVAEDRIAKRLDPLSKGMYRNLLWDVMLAKRWAELSADSAEWRRLWPDDSSTADLYGNSVLVTTLCRNPAGTLSLLQSQRQLLRDTTDVRSDLGVAVGLARSGRKAEALETIRRAERLRSIYARRFWLTWAYAAAGDLDRAASAFRDAAAMYETSLPATVRTCLSEPLRADPRWPELMRLINLTP